MKLHIENLHASLGGARILRSLSLELEGAKFIGLIGPNGVGKTTLVRAIADLIPFYGDITLDGEALKTMPPRTRARKLAYLAQGAESHWPLVVERLVALGRLPHLEPFRAPQPTDEAAIARAMKLADVEALRGRDVLTLSGGERARVLLARALAVEAPLLLVDEPVAALDPYHQIGVMNGLVSYARQGRMVIAVLHDLSLAARYCDELVLLNDGKVHAHGTPSAVLTPRNLRDVYRVEAQVSGEGETMMVMPKTQI
ncbi:MAG: ABC transporter ATP-binding protein [Parvibaculum sp.]